MTGYELLVREHDALKEEVAELKKLVELLMRERQEKIDFDIACMATLKEWDEYNKAEDSKLEALESEGCRNA